MKISAIILAGGRSSRMGYNKALLPLEGVPVMERLVRELEEVADRVIIAGGRPEDYDMFDREHVSDIFPNAGPLAGLHAGLAAASTPWCLVVACDLPFANRAVLNWLAEAARAAEAAGWSQDNGGEKGEPEEGLGLEAIIPVVQGRVQPLLAAYRRSVLAGLEEELRNGNLKMTRWIEGLRVKYADGALLADMAGMPQERISFNMNRPGDYQQAIEWLDET